ncbi:MAG: DNA-processing protein DprA [Solirubrobacteraceae bacterium]
MSDPPRTTNVLGAKGRPGTAAGPFTTAAPTERGACVQCLRHSWLLAELSARLDYPARDRDRDRLLALLALDDEQLIQAIGGRRRRELHERHARFTTLQVHSGPGVARVCRHHRGYPRGLSLAGGRAPRMLYVAGGAPGRLEELSAAPTVAIVGSRRATDYGIEIARDLARGLSASGVTVAGSLTDGVALAAQEGALEAGGKTLTVLDGGLDLGCPARRRALHERLLGTGCVLTELPDGCRPRRWCYSARDRTVVGLAALTVLVEADDLPGDLLGARVARAMGRVVAAVPGRVTSPASRGTHALLIDGAPLVRGPGDVLELLHESEGAQDLPGANPSTGTRPNTSAMPTPTPLEPRLQATLEQVGAGRDTAAKLTAASADAGAALLALGELELMGLLARGDGGRYVPRQSLAGR